MNNLFNHPDRGDRYIVIICFLLICLSVFGMYVAE